MGRVSTTAKSAAKKTATGIGRSTGRLVSNAVKSGYSSHRKRSKRDDRQP